MKKTAYFLTLLGASVLVFSCGNKKEKPAANPLAQVKDYPVITINTQTTTLNSNYPATIEGQQNIEIRPKIDGYIDKIFVDEGATVKKGQLLFQISAPQYEQEVRTAQAAIKIAEASVNAAQMEVNKVRPLVEKKIISEYELESAQFNLQAKQATLAQARATLVNASTNLGYTTITSPVNGVVGTLPYKIGSLVNSNTPQPLTTVSNITNIYAYFSINEKQVLELSDNLKGIREGKLASIPPVSLILANGAVFPQKGHIETANGLINNATGSISVRATFPNPGNIIRSGSSGAVRIPITVDTAIVIPQKATYEIQGKKFVYLVNEDGTVTSRDITIMNNNDGQYYVVQKGLVAGDKIVLDGITTLREGVTIKPVHVNTDSLYQRSESK